MKPFLIAKSFLIAMTLLAACIALPVLVVLTWWGASHARRRLLTDALSSAPFPTAAVRDAPLREDQPALLPTPPDPASAGWHPLKLRRVA